MDNNFQKIYDESTNRVSTTKNPIVVIEADGATNYEGIIVRPDGSSLPTNSDVMEDSTKSQKTTLIIGPDGRPFPTDTYGNYVDLNGNPLLTDLSGNILASDGTPLKFNDQGQIVGIGAEKTSDSSKALTLPTDESGKIVYPIVDSNGKLMELDVSGQHINLNGELINTDEFGRPVDKQGRLLPINSKGQYVYKEGFPNRLGQSISSTYSTGLVGPNGSSLFSTVDFKGNIVVPADSFQDSLLKDIYLIVRPDGSSLRKNSEGKFVGDLGEVIELNDFNQPLQPLTKHVLSKNSDGNYVYKKISVVKPDGSLLPTDSTGNVVNQSGRPLPTSLNGALVGIDGSPLPTNSEGNLMAIEGQEILIVRPDGSPLAKNSGGRYIDDRGNVIPLDDLLRPLDPVTNNVLVKNSDGNYVYKKRLAIGLDGQLLSTDSTENFLNTDKKPLPTRSDGTIIGLDGSSLPTDASGNVNLNPSENDSAKTLPTDNYGQRIYPIVRSDGTPLKKDYYGKYVGPDGEIISTDESRKPLFKDSGKVLPTNSVGEYVYLNPSTYSEEDLIQSSQYPYLNDRDQLDKPDKTCKVSETVTDIIFAINNELLIDSKAPIKNAIKNFIDNEVDLAPDAVRVALLHFGRNLEIPVNLGGYNEKVEVLQKLQAIEHSSLEVPDLLTAYQGAEQQFKEFGRKNTTRILVVFSSGDDMWVFS